MLKNALAVLFGLFVALILLESLLRLFNPLEIRVRGDRLTLPAETVYEFRDVRISGIDAHIIHSKNSLGFRGPEPLRTDDESTIKIMAIGGSTTEGFYLSDGKDWPMVMKRTLKKRGYPVWVNNAGLDGHSTYGHQILLEDHIIPHQPDIVVIMAGLNDIGRNPGEERLLRDGLSFDSWNAFIRSAATYSEAAATAIHLHRVFLAADSGVRHQPLDIRALPQYDEIDYQRIEHDLRWYAEHYTTGYKNRLLQLIDTAVEAEITPVLVTQAVLAMNGTDKKTGVDLSRIAYRGGSGYRLWRIVELYNDATRDVAHQKDIQLIDLSALLPGAHQHKKQSTGQPTEVSRSELFYDMLHFTNKGARLTGELIGHQIEIPSY